MEEGFHGGESVTIFGLKGGTCMVALKWDKKRN